jgi:hypothetical protein
MLAQIMLTADVSLTEDSSSNVFLAVAPEIN